MKHTIQVVSISNIPPSIFLFHYIELFSSISEVLCCGVSYTSPEYYLVCKDNRKCLILNNFILRDKKLNVKIKNIKEIMLHSIEEPTKNIKLYINNNTYDDNGDIHDDNNNKITSNTNNITNINNIYNELEIEIYKYVDNNISFKKYKNNNNIFIECNNIEDSIEIYKYLCGRWYNKQLIWCNYI